MTFLELVKGSRSYRRFDAAHAVDRETLVSLVEAARYAASSVNRQPLKYALSWEKTLNDKIFPHTRWAKLLTDEQFPPQTEAERPTAYILILADKDIAPQPDRYSVDVGICAQTIMLAAREKGLGGCMVGNFDRREVCELMGAGCGLEPMLLLALGKPDEMVVIEELPADGSTAYYNINRVQHVPKRALRDIIIG